MPSQKKVWCWRGEKGKCNAQGHFRASPGCKLGMHFLSREVQDALMDQFKERTRTGNATRAGAGFAVTSHSFLSGSRRNIQGRGQAGISNHALPLSYSLTGHHYHQNLWLLEAEPVLAKLKNCGTNRSSSAEDSSTHRSIPWGEGKHSSPGRSSPGSS